MASLAEIVVPEEAGGDGAPGFPGRAHFFQFFRRGAQAQAFHFLHGGCESEVADGPDVRAAQGAQQINVGGPCADAFEGDQHFACGIVVQVVKISQVKVTARQRFCEQACIQSLLAAEADAQELIVSELQKTARCERTNGNVQAVEGGFRRGERNLLFEDDVNERTEARLANPEWRRAVFLDHFRQVRIAIN